jgi:transposase
MHDRLGGLVGTDQQGSETAGLIQLVVIFIVSRRLGEAPMKMQAGKYLPAVRVRPLAPLTVMARIRTVYADKGHDAEGHRQLCRACQVKPFIHKRGRLHGSGLGRYRWPVERTLSWLLENKPFGLRYDRCGFIIQSLPQTECIFLVAARLAREL